MTVADRFQVLCSYCGFLHGDYTLHDSLYHAELFSKKHNRQDERITVYDTMAHIGKAEQWDSRGRVIRYRDSETTRRALSER